MARLNIRVYQHTLAIQPLSLTLQPRGMQVQQCTVRLLKIAEPPEQYYTVCQQQIQLF